MSVSATADGPVSGPGRARWAVLVFFLASGATGLVLEVTWTRILTGVFGNTVYAASTVLAAYMLGLALGSAVLGPLADRVRRPVVLYGLLEVGVGLYALALPYLADGCCSVYAWVFHAAGPSFALLSAVRFVLSMLLLLGPTFLMGGTLPALGRHLSAGRDEPGREVGMLYGLNTLGAVVGCLLAGLVLIEAWGVRGTLAGAGGGAIVVGLLAVLLGRRAAALPGQAAAPPAKPAGEAPREPRAFRLVLVAFAVTGFCALACEVLWTRVLVFVLGSSVHCFAIMLATFLSALATGSLLSSRLVVPRIRRAVVWFGAIEILVALSLLGSLAVLARLGAVDWRVSGHLARAGAWAPAAKRFVDAFVVVFVPGFWMGMAFPIVTKSFLGGAGSLGRRVGRLYAANTIGCVLGALTAGFVLIAYLGTARGILAVASLNLAVGVVVLLVSGFRRAGPRLAVATVAAGVVVAAFLLTPADVLHRTINTYHHPSRIVFVEEHATGTVAVHDLPNGDRLISVSGVNVAGLDFMLRSTQKLQGYIPLCLHPRPRRVVQIGFGSGETTRVGLDFGVEDYTVVDICPAVFDAGRFFEPINGGSYRDRRVRKIIMDGKNFALLSDETFDVVMNDSTYPGSSGSSALYTVDHFRNCRRRLAPGGLFSCWVPLDLRPAELRMVLKSFQTVFPHASLWVASNCVNKHALILGSLDRLRIDFARVRSVLRRPDVSADLRAVAIHDAYDLLDCHVCDEVALRRLLANAPLNTDDRPRLEFSCATAVAGEGTLKYVLSMLTSRRTPVAPYVVNFADERRDRAELARRFEATQYVFRGQIAQLLAMPTMRRTQFAKALVVSPTETHVRSCDAELAREIRDLRAAYARAPHSRTYALRLAEKLYVAGRYDQAGAIYRDLISADAPAVAVAFTRLANVCFRRGQKDHAEDLLRQCLTLWPNSAEAHDTLAGICLRAGRLDDAQRHIVRAVRLDPDNPYYRDHHQTIHAAAAR